MGDQAGNVTLVTMSEFGRTARENGTGGTDHGHANAMFVLGGQVKGGKVYGQWPGLDNDQLNEGRDLALTTDYRQVLGEVVTHSMGAENLELVFPGARLSRTGFLAAGVEAGDKGTRDQGNKRTGERGSKGREGRSCLLLRIQTATHCEAYNRFIFMESCVPAMFFPGFRSIPFVACAVLLACGTLAAQTTAAQTAPSKLSFDVATIKPSAPLDMQQIAADIHAGKMPRMGPHINADRAEYLLRAAQSRDRDRL